MEFQIIDTQAIYQRLLDTSDAHTRVNIFCEEIIEPFHGLVERFGGGDPLTMFTQWGMSPEHFDEPKRQWAKRVFDGLAMANLWQDCADALHEGWDAFSQYADHIPIQKIVFALLIADMGHVPNGYGYAGFGAVPGWIMTTYGEATPDNLKRAKGATVHELHHNILNVVRPQNFMTETTVGDYMVMEGLAESFAAELYGEDMVGPYVTMFDDTRLEATRAGFHQALDKTGFNTIRGYIFGGEVGGAFGTEDIDVPPFAGYALGYRVVQAYLNKTGQSVVEATFVSAKKIITQSGFFD